MIPKQAEQAISRALAFARENPDARDVPINRFDLYEIDFLVRQLRKDLWAKGSELTLAQATADRARETYAAVHAKHRAALTLGLAMLDDDELRQRFEDLAREIVEDRRAEADR